MYSLLPELRNRDCLRRKPSLRPTVASLPTELAGSARPLHVVWLSTPSHIGSLPSSLSRACCCPASFAPFGGDGGRTGSSVTYRVTFARNLHPEDSADLARTNPAQLPGGMQLCRSLQGLLSSFGTFRQQALLRYPDSGSVESQEHPDSLFALQRIQVALHRPSERPGESLLVEAPIASAPRYSSSPASTALRTLLVSSVSGEAAVSLSSCTIPPLHDSRFLCS